MSASTVSSKAEQYFYSINPLAQRIGQDITATKEAYEGLWNTLSIAERNQAINETIIQPEVALKYTLKKYEVNKELPEWYPTLRIQTGMKHVIDETGATLRWKDEHSAPFSFMTQSQMNLSLIESNEDLKSKSMKAQFGESVHFSSPVKMQMNSNMNLSDNYNRSICRYDLDSYSSSTFENDECRMLIKTDTSSDNSDNIFAKLINKTSLLKLQDVDGDMETLVLSRDSTNSKSQISSFVAMSSTKSSDINESTALLETPSSYSSFQSSQLNQDEEERSIPKTGFEFLDNW